MSAQSRLPVAVHDDVIKWKHFRRYWPFVWGIHRSSVNSPLKGQWRGALVFSLIYVWINGWVHNHDAGDLRRHHAHLDVTVIGDGMALANRKRITHWNGNAVLTNLLSPWLHKKLSLWQRSVRPAMVTTSPFQGDSENNVVIPYYDNMVS